MNAPIVGVCLDRKRDYLYAEDETCAHVIQAASGGGIKCLKCTGWFCY